LRNIKRDIDGYGGYSEIYWDSMGLRLNRLIKVIIERFIEIKKHIIRRDIGD